MTRHLDAHDKKDTSNMQDARRFHEGDRIRLIYMPDRYRKDIPLGITGTVTQVAPPPINVLTVDWDTDFYLNPCLDEDRVEKIYDRPEA